MNANCKPRMWALLALIIAVGTSAEAFAGDKLIGKFCGSLESSGQMVPAETDLYSDGKGGLTGIYHFDDHGKTYTGLFTRGKLVGGGSGEWLLQWTDAFGVGTLDIQFGSDVSHFEGKWGAGKQRPSLPWNGKLCELPATS